MPGTRNPSRSKTLIPLAYLPSEPVEIPIESLVASSSAARVGRVLGSHPTLRVPDGAFAKVAG